MNTKHGIIDWHNGSTIGNADPFLPPNLRLDEICTWGVDNGYTHVWILPDSGIDPTRAWFEEARAEWNLLATWQGKDAPADVPNLLRSVHGWRRKEAPANAGKRTNALDVIFCGEQAGWEWARTPSPDARSLLAVIDSLENNLHVPVGGSPGMTGYHYMTKTLAESKKGELLEKWKQRPYIVSDHLTFHDLPWAQAARFLQWDRQPTAQELQRPHLIKIDKNAAFPSAAKDEKFGCGRLKHYRGRDALALLDDPTFNVKTPGLWNVTLSPPAAPEQRTLASKLPPVKDGWMVTSLLRAARSLGYTVKACEQAWLFEESHYFLQSTMHNLWNMRAPLPVGDPRRDAYKQIMNDLNGLFHMEGLPVDDLKNRPDVYAGAVGGNYARMLQNMEAFFDKWGLLPLLVYTDCIIYASFVPMADLLPNNLNSLGGYKWEWELRMTDEVRDILTCKTARSTKLQMLNTLAKAELVHGAI